MKTLLYFVPAVKTEAIAPDVNQRSFPPLRTKGSVRLLNSCPVYSFCSLTKLPSKDPRLLTGPCPQAIHSLVRELKPARQGLKGETESDEFRYRSPSSKEEEMMWGM